MRRAASKLDSATLSGMLRVEDLPPHLVFTESGRRVRCVTKAALDTASALKGVVTMGVYAAKRVDSEYYFSIEGTQLLGPYLRQGVLEVSTGEAEGWMRGAPIVKEVPEARIVFVRTGWLFLGSGRASRDGKVYPLIPKERMISSSATVNGG